MKTFVLKQVDKRLPFIANAYAGRHADNIIKGLVASTYIVSPMATLHELEQYILAGKKGAYMRFGDGDVYLALGKNDLYQKVEKLLSEELIAAFNIRGEGIFKSLSIHSSTYGHDENMYYGNHLVTPAEANNLLRSVYSSFVGYKIYSPVALHFAATYHPAIANNFLRTLKSKTVLFIGNEEVSESTVVKIFGAVRHIKTPSRNAYKNMDEISEKACCELEKVSHFGVVVVSMGCSGRALIKRLYRLEKNVFYFDFGSLLDGIVGQKTRTWLKKAEIDYPLLLNNL